MSEPFPNNETKRLNTRGHVTEQSMGCGIIWKKILSKIAGTESASHGGGGSLVLPHLGCHETFRPGIYAIFGLNKRKTVLLMRFKKLFHEGCAFQTFTRILRK